MTVASLRIAIGSDFDGSGLQSAAKSIGALGDRLQAAGRAMTASVTLPLAALGVASVRAAGRMESMELALKAVMGSSEAAKAELDKLRKTAETPGLGFEQAVRASLQLQNVGQSADQARALIAGLGNAIALSGGTADDFGEVSRQLSQIASLGRVTAENLNVILERSPAMAQALQAAFGTTSAEAIRELGLSSEEFLTRLQQGLAALPTAEGGIMNDLANAGDNLKVALVPLGEAIGRIVLPAVLGLTAAAASLSAWFDGLPEGVQAAAVGVGIFAAALGPILVAVGTLLTLLPSVAAGFAFVKAAVLTAGGSLSFLLGPVGLVVAAVAALGAIAVASGADFGILRDSAIASWRQITAAVGPAVQFIAQVVRVHLAAIQAWWQAHGQTVVAVVRTGFNVLFRVFSAASQTLSGIMAAFLHTLTGNWRGAFGSLRDTAVSVFRTIAGQAHAAASSAAQSFQMVGRGATSQVEFDPASGTFRRPAAMPAMPAMPDLPPMPALSSGGGGGAASAAAEVDEVGQALESVSERIADTTLRLGRFVQAGQMTALEAGKARLEALTQAMGSAAEVATERGAAAFRNYTTWAVETVREITAAFSEAGGPLALTPMGLMPIAPEDLPAVTSGEGALDAISGFRERLKAEADQIIRLSNDIAGAVRDAIADGITTVAEGIGGMLAGTSSLGDLGKNLLGVIAGLMGRLGKLLIGFGTAGLLFQSSGGFLSFLTNPIAAIGAGALLVAAGAAIKSTLSSAGGGGSRSRGGYAVSSTSVNPNTAATAGVGSANAAATAGAASASAAPQQTFTLQGTTVASGDLEFSVQQGARRSSRYATPLS